MGTLLGLAALTVAPRLAQGGLVNFSRDDSWLLLFARRWVEGGLPPLVGIGSSQGVQNGALTVYLTALPFWLGGDAQAAFALVAVLHGLAAAGVAWWGGRYFGWAAGLAAGLLFAVQPWSVVYGRSLALAAFVPPFAIGYVASLAAFAVERRRWALPAAGLLAGLLPAVHLGGIWLWPLLPVIALSRPRLLSVRLVALTAAGIVLPFVPWLVWNARRGWPDLALLRDYAAGTSRVTAAAWRLLWDMSGAGGYGGTLGAAFERFVARGGLAPAIVDGLLHAALLAGIVWCLAGIAWPRVVPNLGAIAPGRRGYLLLLAWLVCVPLALTRTSRDVFPHYVFLAFPAPQLLAGFGLGAPVLLAARRLPSRLRILPLAAFAGVLLLTAFFGWRSYRAYLTTYAEGGTAGGYGAPLADQAAALDRVFVAAGASPVYLAAADDRPGLGGEATNWEFLRAGRPAALVAAPDYLIYPEVGPGYYLLAPEAGAVSAPGLTVDETLPSGYRVATVPAGRAVLAAQRFDAGHYEATAGLVRLIGQTASLPWRPGHAQRIAVWWQPLGTPAGEPYPYGLSLQLFDPAGRRVAQEDQLTYPATRWTPGETIVSFFDLSLPPDAPAGAYSLRTILYEKATGTPLDWRDPAGQNAGSELRTAITVAHPGG